MAKSTQRPKLAKEQITKKATEDAASDARKLVAESAVIRTTVSTMIISRQLYQLARSVLDTEIMHGWEVDNPELIIQTLVMSAQEKSVQPLLLTELQQNVLRTIVPFVDVLIQQQREQPAAETPAATAPVTEELEPTTDGNSTPANSAD